MPELEIRLRQGDPVLLSCDSWSEEEETEGGVTVKWLCIYRGGQRVARYRLDDIVGYHEESPRPPPHRMR
jgi:hypothetical protein